jgi:hypothetical protein
VPTFCRHNRFFADCPICSKGTVLDPARSATRRPRASSAKRRAQAPPAGAALASRGPFASAGPYDGAEIRLERVPGGLRMASWRGGQIERAAPVLDVADLPGLLAEADEKDLLAPVALDAAGPAGEVAHGASPGRSGELRDELRVERLDGDRVRIARWIMRPNRGWELQETPVLLPPARFEEALEAAAAAGALGPAAVPSDPGG